MRGERKEYIEVSLETTPELGESLSSLLIESGADGAWINDGRVTAYFKPGSYSAGMVEEKTRLFCDQLRAEGVEIPHFRIESEVRPGSDWNEEWKKHFKPICVTDGLTVSPPWETPSQERQKGKIIWIDPGMGFGTGTHPTTRNCLVLLDRFFRQAGQIGKTGMTRALDLGSGSGILAIAMALYGAGDIVAADIDGEAIESMRHNFLLNQVGKKIRLRLGSVLLADRGGYDLVAANLTAGDLVRLGREIAGSLSANGTLIVSGILSERRPDVESCFKSEGLTKADEIEEDHWLTQVWRKG